MAVAFASLALRSGSLVASAALTLRSGSRTGRLLPPDRSGDSSRCELLDLLGSSISRRSRSNPVAGLTGLALLFLAFAVAKQALAQTTPAATAVAPAATSGTALSPEAAGAFSRASGRYSDGSAHSAGFVQIYTPAGFTTAKRESGTLWIQAPQKLRFDYEAPEKKTFTYAGGEGRLFTPEDKQLTIQKLSAEERARLPIVFLSDPSDLGRVYVVSAEAGDGGVMRLLLRPRAPRPDLAWLRVAVGKDGAVSELAYEDASGNRTEFRFDGWHSQKARPVGDYQIAGPKGTRIVEN